MPDKDLEEGAGPGAPADALIGRDVGPCRLEQVLGKGGMGTVYRGRHATLDRAMAVKVLSTDTLSEAAAERLLAEARAAAAVEDPRVVRIYDAGRQGALRYVVMQLIEGETLEARVARTGPLAPAEALQVMREVLRGLAAAHEKGLVHRDVKPANIMLENSGGVKILDFGLAAAVGKESGGAPADAPAGSFDFMAPEQGFDAAPDPRQDLYAFGSTWFYALAGLPPFSAGDAASMLLMHREAPVPDVRAANREVTSQAAALIQRLMDKDPQRRPASADEVLAALDAPGMVLEVAAERSPFVILPPPPEPQAEGLAADPVVQAALRAAPASEPDAPLPLPAPPPELPPPPRMALSAKVLLGAGFALLFGRYWLSVGPEDLLGLSLSCAATLCGLSLVDGADWLRRSASAVLFAAMAGASWMLAAAGAPGAAPPGVELLVGAGLGLALGLAGLVLGFWTASRDRWLGCALLAGSAAVLLLVSAAAALPAGASYADGVPARLLSCWAALRASGGLHRWAGVAAALFCAVVAKLTPMTAA